MIPVWLLPIAAAIAGLVMGSFLNVCIVRLPRHQSIVTPSSHCLHCGRPIHVFDNIPVLSWIWLGGRCRACHTGISLQYPLVELGTALLFVGCVLHTGAAWTTLIDAAACFFLFGLAIMDAQTLLLPDAFTLTGLVVALLLRIIAPDAENRWQAALRTLEDAAIAAGALLFVWALYRAVRRREGLGLGDVKLLAMMAAFLGLPLTLFAFFVGVLTAALFAMVLLALRRVHGSDRISFGSFLAAAGVVSLFLGQPVVNWYLSLFC